MKIVKHLAIWVAISLIVQLGALFYLDKYYLVAQTKFKSKEVFEATPKKQDVKVKIPTDATQINISYEGTYLSYMQNGSLIVVNTTNNDTKTFSPAAGNTISMYKWLNDKDRVYVVERTESNFQLYYYDAVKDASALVKNITYSTRYSSVTAIGSSAMTNMDFFKINRGETTSYIYYKDIMNNVGSVDTVTSRIGKMYTLLRKPEVIYEDTYNGKIYDTVYDSSSYYPINISGSKVNALIGVDDSDNVYIGDVVNNLVDKIYYGNLKDTTDKWQSIALAAPTDPNNIFVTQAGDICVNNPAKNQVLSLKSNNITAYKGTFIEMSDAGIISNDKGILVKTMYK